MNQPLTYSISAPGSFIAFSYSLFAGLFVWQGKRRFSAGATLLLQLAWHGLTALLACLVESPDPRLYLLRFLLFLFLAALQIRVLTEFPSSKCAYFFSYAFVLAEFTTALDWHLYYYGVNVKGVPDIPLIRIPFFVGIYGVIWGGAFLTNRRCRDFYQEMTVRRKDLTRAFVLAALTFLAANLSNVFQDTPFSSSIPGQIFLLRVLINLTGVVSMHLVQVTRMEEENRRQADTLKRLMEQMYANYQISQRSIEMVSIKYHDLKHQLAVMKAAGLSPAGSESISRMEEEISAFESQERSGSKVLDTILMSARLSSQREGIEITSIADGRLLSFLDEMDTAALLGNLLDNALEALRALPEGRARLLRFTLEEKKGFVILLCENTYAGERRIEGGTPLTTKADTAEHGFGTKSIRLIAEKYGGSALFTAEEGWFRVKVLFPRDFSSPASPDSSAFPASRTSPAT